jgi:hypothetical protein
MKSVHLNTGGAAAGAAKTATGAGKGFNFDPISKGIETFGKIGVQIIDASKRRQMDYSFNQQKLQAELGLAEKSQAQQYELAKLNAIAQAAGGSKSPEKTNNTALYVGLGVAGIAVLGTIIYFVTKK